jgi:glycosyltransferase involved in cell wall biosynthesis
MKTRVLRIIARMNIGGPAIQATLLSECLDPDRYETCLVAGTTGPAEGDYLELVGRRLQNLTYVPALGREIAPLRDLIAYRRIADLIREFRPHIVHTHTAKAGLIGRLAARLAGVPVIVHTFHGHVLHGYFSRSKEEMFIRLERALACSTTRLVAVSDQVRSDLLALRIGRPDRFDVVRLGLDLSRFEHVQSQTGALRQELGISPETRTVGIIARLVPIKAHEVFLDMAAIIARERPDTVFLIVGDGERRASLEAAARARGIFEQTRFLGWRSDLDRIYADLDAVVLTSRNEGSPVALIEAMAAARPVVATRVGGVPELVGEAGLLTDVDDSAALAAAVQRLLDAPALAAHLGRQARARVVPTFSHERLVGDIDALYQRLLAQGIRSLSKATVLASTEQETTRASR